MVVADRVKTLALETPVCPYNKCYVLPFLVLRG
jgi:hypothetical protein